MWKIKITIFKVYISQSEYLQIHMKLVLCITYEKWNGHVYNSVGKLLWNASDSLDRGETLWTDLVRKGLFPYSAVLYEFKKMAGVHFSFQLKFVMSIEHVFFLSEDLVELALECGFADKN